MGGKLIPYSFKVHYIKGCSNVVADCLSRHPSESCGNFFDFNINIATMHGDMLPCVTMMELSHATAEDPILQRVIKYTLTKWPISVDSESQPYFRFRDEFGMDSGLLLRGDKIVVPTSIQQRLLHFTHENHFLAFQNPKLAYDVHIGGRAWTRMSKNLFTIVSVVSKHHVTIQFKSRTGKQLLGTIFQWTLLGQNVIARVTHSTSLPSLTTIVDISWLR